MFVGQQKKVKLKMLINYLEQQIKPKAIYFIIIIGIISSPYFFSSCENLTEYEKLKPGRRDYVWMEDTLDVATGDYMTFRHITGNSPDDIWLGTLGASYNARLWHYDGEKWESMPFPTPGYIPSALLFFDDNTLWAGTPQDYIWKRENGEWSISYKIELEGYDKISIYGICGETKENIYAVGWATNYTTYAYRAIILHYNGEKWDFVDIPDLRVGFNDIMYQKSINTYFIQ